MVPEVFFFKWLVAMLLLWITKMLKEPYMITINLSNKQATKFDNDNTRIDFSVNSKLAIGCWNMFCLFSLVDLDPQKTKASLWLVGRQNRLVDESRIWPIGGGGSCFNWQLSFALHFFQDWARSFITSIWVSILWPAEPTFLS